MRAARRLARLCLALIVLLAAPPGRAQLAPVPALTAHVTDQAGMLSARERAALERALADYAARSGSQIAVLLVASTEPEAIEQYSIRVTDAWKLGRKGVDDGVLLLVAKNNPPALRRLRIEAGRGVQGVLTDAQSKRVLQDVIAPRFRQNDYYGGLVAGTGAIEALLNQEKFPAPAAHGGDDAGSLGDWLPLLLFGALVLLVLFRSRGRRIGAGGWGRSAGGVVLGSGLGSGFGHSSRHHGGFGGGGGGGGFSGGGGGFSGGGGGFDGGGASGNW